VRRKRARDRIAAGFAGIAEVLPGGGFVLGGPQFEADGRPLLCGRRLGQRTTQERRGAVWGTRGECRAGGVAQDRDNVAVAGWLGGHEVRCDLSPGRHRCRRAASLRARDVGRAD
jgi:hypothetical protein